MSWRRPLPRAGRRCLTGDRAQNYCPPHGVGGTERGDNDDASHCSLPLPPPPQPKLNYSIDEDLFHAFYESGVLEDAGSTYEESMFKMSVSPQAALDKSIQKGHADGS